MAKSIASNSTAFRERIDMALFGPLPGFIRVSIRLTGESDAPLDGRGARSAAALLSRLSIAAAENQDAVEARFELWRRAYAAIGLPATTVPPPEALRAWALSPVGIPSQGVVEDVINSFALENVVPAAAYDLAAIGGDLWLRPSRGHEFFETADGKSITPTINEFILADDADRVVAMAWHGAQSASTRVRRSADDILIHVDLLDVELTVAQSMADALAARLVGFVGGRARTQLLRRDKPMVTWQA